MMVFVSSNRSYIYIFATILQICNLIIARPAYTTIKIMIKLLIDPQIFHEQKFGGISRYHVETLNILSRQNQVKIELPIFFSSNKHYLDSDISINAYQKKNKYLIKFSKLFRAYKPKNLKKRNILSTVQLLEKQDFDIFVTTYYDPYFLKSIGSKPFVLTVHDMIHELLPQYSEGQEHIIRNKKLLIEKADAIIAVSENTKADILKLYPHISPKKIKVIHLATSVSYDSLAIHMKLPPKYILFVGNRSLYKNFDFFIRTIASLLKAHSDLYLVCAGGNAFDTGELELINDLNISNLVIQKQFQDDELSTYYANASCFVFPSLYEGFGIPVIEAMACGCPVILGHHSSFPEIAGDAGIYFDINKAEDLLQKINRILTDPEYRSFYKKKGQVRASEFSWEKTAQACLELYQETASLKIKHMS